jgi:hypothetical protein
MKNFAEKIRLFLKPKNDSSFGPGPGTGSFDFVKTRKGILKELVISKQSKNIVGVYCKVFGEGMFLTAVEGIEPTSKAEIIVFHQYDMTGNILPRTRIELDEIQMVCPFDKIYQNPLFSSNKKPKTSYFPMEASTSI